MLIGMLLRKLYETKYLNFLSELCRVGNKYLTLIFFTCSSLLKPIVRSKRNACRQIKEHVRLEELTEQQCGANKIYLYHM